MSHITIVREDNFVQKDSFGINGISMDGVSTDVHAVQFDTTTNTGTIEKVDGTHEDITSLDSFNAQLNEYDTVKADMDSAEAQAQADREAYINSYVYAREQAYPSIGDQLDMMYHDQINDTNTWKDKITQVKADNPKS